MSETQSSHAAQPLKWRRTGSDAGRAMFLQLPAGEIVIVRLKRATQVPERRLWEVEADGGVFPRRYLCTSWPAAKSVVRDELYRLGWPA